MKRKAICFEEHETLEDGQRELVVRHIKRIPTKTVQVRLEPTPIAASIGGVRPLIAERNYIDRHVQTEIRRYRWMKPDGNGGLVPR